MHDGGRFEETLNRSEFDRVCGGELKTKEELMNLKNYFCVSGIAAIAIGGGIWGAGVSTAWAIETSQGMEVMTRGPVHEAFAETVAFDPAPGIIVTQQPPALIEEVMPDQRPAGDNVAWIPGYWGWDEDQNDFLWISGIWRNLPPGREWVPGYWSAVDSGHQWTSGYWQDAEAAEVSYLPEPPRSVERGPNIAASSNDQTWIPGSWQYRQDRYAWRAGYWVTARENWCWTPSYYRWAPRGYVYVDGYWDYPVVNRGVIFAPVRFQRSYYEQPDFYYSPQTVISLSVFSNHLFLRPNYGHYYFGDYYEPRYRDNYYASYDYGSRYRGYDPIYAYNRWENRRDGNWDRERQDYYEYRRDHAEARPPRTWAALNERPERDRERGDFAVADRYDRVVDSHKDGRNRFQTVSNDERQRFVSQKNEIRNYGRERQQREVSGARAKGDSEGRTQATREKAIRSPLASKPSDRSEKNGGPPERLQKRSSESGEMATNGGRNGKPSQAGRNVMETPKANSREADKRGGNATAKNLAEPNSNGESRTKPGQRRDDATTSKSKPQQAAESNRRSNAQAGGRTEMDRKATPSSASKANPEPKRNASPGVKNSEKPQANNNRQPSEKRADNPNAPRREQPTPQRQATPQNERKSAQPESRNLSKQEAPSRKASPAPTREPNQKAAPQNAQPRPQQQSQPQRQQAPRSEPRQAQPSPQRQQAPRPEPRQSQPAPQRQTARPSPQPQQSAPRPQTEARPSRKTEATSDSKSEGRKNR